MGDYANDAVMMVMAIMAADDEGDDEPRVRLKEHCTGDVGPPASFSGRPGKGRNAGGRCDGGEGVETCFLTAKEQTKTKESVRERFQQLSLA